MGTPKYGTIGVTAVIGDELATITGTYRADELSYVKVTYEIRHRTDTTSLKDLSAIFNASPSHIGKRGFRLENPNEDGYYHVIEQYSIVKPIDESTRQLFLSLV